MSSDRSHDDGVNAAEASPADEVTRRRVRRRVRVRKRETMSPRVRLALLIGLAIAALVGAFLAGRFFV